MKINDVVSSFFSNQWLGFAYAYCCDFEKAGQYFKKAHKINIETKNIWGTSVVMGCISHWVLNYKGSIAKGYKLSRKALKLAKKSGDIYSKAIAYTLHGTSLYFKGEDEAAEKYLSKGATLNAKIGFKFVRALAHFFLGHSYYQMSVLHKPQIQYTQAMEILEDIQCLPSLVTLCQICILLTKDEQLDKKILYQVKNDASNNGLKVFEGWMFREIGNLAIGSDPDSVIEAEQWIKKAIQTDERSGLQWQLAKDYVLYSKILELLGKEDEASQNLQKAKKFDALCHAG